MKTTVELPDDLFAEAKATALRRRISLKTLFTLSLERELRGFAVESGQQRFCVDETGWPVLRTASDDTTVVSTDLVNELRESGGG
jgi:hypothetical protein